MDLFSDFAFLKSMFLVSKESLYLKNSFGQLLLWPSFKGGDCANPVDASQLDFIYLRFRIRKLEKLRRKQHVINYVFLAIYKFYVPECTIKIKKQMVREIVVGILKELIISSKNKADAKFRESHVEALVYYLLSGKKKKKAKSQSTHSHTKNPLVLKTNLNFYLCSKVFVFMF